MRLKHVKGAKETLLASEIVINDPIFYQGRWNEVFNNNNPIHIEVGMGKGQFISELASKNPDINYIGIERYDSVLVRAIEKCAEYQNIKLIRFDATNINEIFKANEIARIYLNFSDPWPKKRHAKRRLTSKVFLEKYLNILVSTGELHFKTDNQGLFEYSLESISKSNFYFNMVSLDLHNSGDEDNVMTEYEEKFYQQGKKIYKLVAKIKKTF